MDIFINNKYEFIDSYLWNMMEVFPFIEELQPIATHFLPIFRNGINIYVIQTGNTDS